MQKEMLEPCRLLVALWVLASKPHPQALSCRLAEPGLMKEGCEECPPSDSDEVPPPGDRTSDRGTRRFEKEQEKNRKHPQLGDLFRVFGARGAICGLCRSWRFPSSRSQLPSGQRPVRSASARKCQ
eukprot:scaffold273_cov242-Pinguiococcus_pyrenoidosus.AAC.20